MGNHKISPEYIDIAVRLRKEYFANISSIETKTSTMDKCKEELETLNKEVEDVKEDDPDINKIIIDKMTKLEITLNRLHSEILPIYERIQELGKEADMLFDGIMEKYPGITPEEIKEQIIPHLE